MDTYSSKGSVSKEPEKKTFIVDYTRTYIARISVEGFNLSKVPEDEIRIKLINHFKSCGDVVDVNFPAEHLLDRRAFVTIFGYSAKEKALQLNGSDMGSWTALVKFAPEQEEEEYKVRLAYEDSLYDELENDKRFMFGISVEGYDTSLPEDEVERALTAHFSSCGEITHVYVSLADKYTNIYFSEEEGEARAMDLDGSQVDGFKITTTLVTTTARSNRSFAPGETSYGFCIPGHVLEFGHEFLEKVNIYMTEWRLNAMLKKLRAIKKKHARALKKKQARALRKQKAWATGRGVSPFGKKRMF